MRRRAFDTLLRLLQEPAEESARAAASALGELAGLPGWPADLLSELAPQLPSVHRKALVDGLLRAGAGPWDRTILAGAIAEDLGSPDHEARERSCMAVASFWHRLPDAAAILETRIDDPDPSVRAWAAILRSRAEHTTPRSFLRLEEILDRAPEPVTAAAAEALASEGLPGLYALLGRLKSRNAPAVARALVLHVAGEELPS